MYFKKIAGWITRRSLILLIALALLAPVLDSTTAFLLCWFKPESFSKYEENPLARAAFYYGRWEKFLDHLIVIICLIFGPVLFLKYFRKEIFLNFFLIVWIITVIGATSTNVLGIILDTTLPGKVIFHSMRFLGFILLILGLKTQFSADDSKKNT